MALFEITRTGDRVNGVRFGETWAGGWGTDRQK